MQFEFKSRWNGRVLFETEAGNLRLALEAGVKQDVNFKGVILDGASLDNARLDGARLVGASLVGASLVGASLDNASLDGASLDNASLVGASLVGASLDNASLDGASLDNARLDGACLVGARLVGASLDNARLVGASLDGARLDNARLVGARLDGASLDGARLDGARLDGASLDGARLTPIRDDLWAVLSSAPDEAEGLLCALRAGRVDGSTYQGECACLVGTLANCRHVKYDEIPGLKPNSSRPAEAFFCAIRCGHTPENSQFAKLAAEWTEEWITRMRAAFAPTPVDSGR